MAKGIELKQNKLFKKKPINLSPQCRRIIKCLIVLLCISGLIFQVTQLVLQYMARRTIVHLEFETLWYNRLPAITICYPNLIAMNRTVEKFPELQSIYNDYKKSLQKASEYEFHDRKLQTKLNNIYEEKFVNFVKQKNLSFAELSELSIPYKFTKRTFQQVETRTLYNYDQPDYQYSSLMFFSNWSQTPIDVYLTGLRRFKNGTIRYDEVEDTTPIESVVLNHKLGGDMSKCFTFFSHLNKSMRYYQMNIKEIHITVRHHWDWFSPTIYNKRHSKLLFAMHSANTIPHNLDTFMELETRWYYEIRYNRWKTILLPEPYKTKCINYNLESNTFYKLRSDCVNFCITRELDLTCMQCERHINKTCDKCFIRSDYLWRPQTAKKHQDTSRKLCKDLHQDESTDQDLCIFENQAQISHGCEDQCPPECHNRYYNFAIFSKERLVSELKDSPNPWDIETKIYIGHNQLPDQTTEHIEEMSFVSFAGNFGGLFGIWMGLSAFAILHYILKLL